MLSCKYSIKCCTLKVTYYAKYTFSCLFNINICPRCVWRPSKYEKRPSSLILSCSTFQKICVQKRRLDLAPLLASEHKASCRPSAGWQSRPLKAFWIHLAVFHCYSSLTMTVTRRCRRYEQSMQIVLLLAATTFMYSHHQGKWRPGGFKLFWMEMWHKCNFKFGSCKFYHVLCFTVYFAG